MKFNFTSFPALETQRIFLKAAVLKDTKAVFDLRSCKKINKFVGTKRIESLDEAKDFIIVCKSLYTNKKRVFWLITFQQQVIGSIVLHRINLDENYAEIGYKLKPEYQKKGLMSEAMQTVLEFGLQQLNLKTIEAFTHKNNIASIALLKKHNFVYQPERRCNVFDFNRVWKLEVI
ncbi:GNAT family N-acetyltransferase [Polaribacter sp. R77954]|uniref:GNAT family N-acetyltransferase n=1 Tax=Polaribacter sp. R77954 TaxID=3093870 RepID=UPI0037C8E189